MIKTTTVMGLAVVASLALSGCSNMPTSEGNGSGAQWEATAFPAAAMGSPDKVIPAGTYDFTFTSKIPFEDGSPAETIKASGLITLGGDVCAMTADVETVSAGKPGKFRIMKESGKGIHVYDYAAKQWVTDPISVAFMPVMTYAGAGLAPRADIYGSFCVLNGIALIAEKRENEKADGRHEINEKVLNQYTQANADWYVNEILETLSYAGDTREAAVKTLQKYFRLDAVDASYQAEAVLTISTNASGVIKITGTQGKSTDFDPGTFVLTPTRETVKAKVPAGEVPTLWTDMIISGVEATGSLNNYLGIPATTK